MKIEVGDKIQFKKLKWVITEKKRFNGRLYYKYKVYRKYKMHDKRNSIWLNNTKCTYNIFDWRWNNLKKYLKKNPNFHYTQSAF